MKYVSICILAWALVGGAVASPGAHGPNGEHLDGPAGAAVAGTVPRLEVASETFELVGQLSGGEFSVMIDRFETNEPVLNGALEVEYKGIKARAKFHADMGDYAIDDAKFLQALAAPGKHALLFTFIAGEESDLLEGTLDVAAPPVASAAPRRYLGAGLFVAFAGILAALTLLIRRRNRKGLV